MAGRGRWSTSTCQVEVSVLRYLVRHWPALLFRILWWGSVIPWELTVSEISQVTLQLVVLWCGGGDSRSTGESHVGYSTFADIRGWESFIEISKLAMCYLTARWTQKYRIFTRQGPLEEIKCLTRQAESLGLSKFKRFSSLLDKD